jgi:excisionase family DNA binding protein
MLSSLTGLLSLAEAAIHCGISQKTLERHIRAGRIRTVKVGRRTFVPAEEVLAVHTSGLPAAAPPASAKSLAPVV